MSERKRISQYSLLRIVGIAFVLIGHAAALQYAASPADFPAGEIGYTGNFAGTFKFFADYIYTFHMPLFFFLSGAVAHVSKRADTTFESLFQSKFRHLILPYFGFLLLYSMPVKTFTGIFSISDAAQIVINSALTTKDSGYLWFLYKLFVVTMLFYLFDRFVLSRRRTLGISLLVAATVLGLGVPSVLFIGVELKYLLFYALGFLFDEHRETFVKVIEKRRVPILAVFAAYFFLFFFKNFAFVPELTIINHYLLQSVERAYSEASALISIIAWFALCCVAASFAKVRDSRAVIALDRSAMSVYLLHDPMNYLIDFGYAAAVTAGVYCTPGVSAFVIALKLAAGLFLSLFVAKILGRLLQYKSAHIAVTACTIAVYLVCLGYIYVANVF
ncbi:MAG: acyltransferase [Oscillospiraceae bacterium]